MTALSLDDRLQPLWEEHADEPLKVAQMLLKDALDDGQFEKSLKNCHHKGMHSIVLFDESETGGGMARFFYARHGEHAMNSVYDRKGHFTLGMHNHRFSLDIIPLVGTIANIEAEETTARTGMTLHEYEYISALGHDIDDDVEAAYTRHLREVMFTPLEERQIEPGQSHSMAASEIHTVLVPDTVKTQATAWLVIEGPDEHKNSRIYSPRDDLVVTTTDLYHTIARVEAVALTEWVLNASVRGY